MNIDMQQLLHDHGISIADAGDKHTSPGWINIDCPHCGDRKKHLGWNVGKQFFHCWKCGAARTDETLAELLNIGGHEVWLLLKRYEMRPRAAVQTEKQELARRTACIVPGDDLQQMHRSYLASRNYNVDQLSIWQLQGTGHLAKGTDKFRVICPIYYGSQIVSWQGRDITGKSPLRWKSCPQEIELRAHKHCLGGEQLVPGDSAAVVEGFTDAWRLGPGAVCTFGTAYAIEQVALLRKYKRRFVVLDSKDKDPNASVQAEKLCNMLSAFDGETVLVTLDSGDPGDLSQDDADHYMTHEWRIRK